jgi:hypothetical protein
MISNYTNGSLESIGKQTKQENFSKNLRIKKNGFKIFFSRHRMKIYEKKIKAPTNIPKLSGPTDTTYFERCSNYKIINPELTEYENEIKDF